MVERVVATQSAEHLIARLKEKHGALLFHQSGGCCDGSSPMCFPKAEFRTGQVMCSWARSRAVPFISVSRNSNIGRTRNSSSMS